jgi:peptidoglycan hydrolase CwlO-like protein
MSDNTKDRVSELKASIKNAQAEIEAIQSQCQHPEHKTKDVGANGV